MSYGTLNEDLHSNVLQNAAEALMKVGFMEPAPELGEGWTQYVHFLDIDEAWEYLEECGPQRPLEYLEPEVASSKRLFDAWSAVVNFLEQKPAGTHARGSDFHEEAGVGDLLDRWELPSALQGGAGARDASSEVQLTGPSGITLEEAQPELEAAQTRLNKNVTAMNALRRALATWDEEAYENSPFLPLPSWYASAFDGARG